MECKEGLLPYEIVAPTAINSFGVKTVADGHNLAAYHKSTSC